MRSLLAAGLGMMLGIGASQLMQPSPVVPPSESDAVAWVNGQPIPRSTWQRTRAALIADKGALSEADERLLLDRLIEEELLVQHGLGLGLAAGDTRIRALLVDSVLSMEIHRAAREADDETIQAFYQDNLHRFRAPARLHVRARYFADEVAAQVARSDPSAPGAALPLPLPDAPLPPTKLADYLGSEIVQRIERLTPGEQTRPLAWSGGYVLIVLVAMESGEVQPLSAVEAEVRAEWLRQAGEEGVRDFLDARRRAAHIQLDR